MNNAAYIAAADPQTILALLDENDRQAARIAELDRALEKSLAEAMALYEVLSPFALFAKPAAIELAGGDSDKIGTVLLHHGNQSLGLGAFTLAREVWDEINATNSIDTALKGDDGNG